VEGAIDIEGNKWRVWGHGSKEALELLKSGEVVVHYRYIKEQI